MYKKIFVSNRAGIGDVILTTPILKAVKTKFPDSHLIFMTGSNCAEVAKGLNFVDEVLLYNKNDKDNNSMLNIVKKIWRSDIALMIDFKYRTAVMAFLAFIPIRAGLRHKRRLFMTNAVDKGNLWEKQYETLNYADIIRESTGMELAGDLTELYVPDRTSDDIDFVNNLFELTGIDNKKPIITIAPFTSWEPKNWPVSNYNQLINQLKNRYDCNIVLIGDNQNFDKSIELESASVKNLLGKTNLLQTVEIISRSQLVIGGCSAPLHMAAATHTPVVGIYGPTSPDRWAPKKNSIIFYKRVSCSPCNEAMIGCKKKPCVLSISVEEVFAACSKFLN